MVRYKQAPFVGLYERTFEKHGLKMKSYVAVQKKLLALIFALWKTGQPYDAGYKNKHTRGLEQELPLGLASAEATIGDSAGEQK